MKLLKVYKVKGQTKSSLRARVKVGSRTKTLSVGDKVDAGTQISAINLKSKSITIGVLYSSQARVCLSQGQSF